MLQCGMLVPVSRLALACCVGIAIVHSIVLPTQALSTLPMVNKDLCLSINRRDTRLSRLTLAWLIQVPTGTDAQTLIARLGQPYCQMTAEPFVERYAYPLAFDPGTWLIIVYKNGQYDGYDFSFHNRETGEL